MKWFVKVILFCTLILGACSNKEETLEENSMLVEKPMIKETSYNSAVITVSIINQPSEVKEKGICYSTHSTPNTMSSTVKSQDESPKFSVSLKELSVNTLYYIRAYAITKEHGLVYSEVQSFSTLDPGIPDELKNYIAPTYGDDYTPIADWINHQQWNLANVHDPTVFKADDGYYYMYQTDASYGGAHERGGGHFHCRRSKDLVHWEYLGGVIDKTPAWIKEKLNSYRQTLGLSPIDNPSYGYWAPVARRIAPNKYRLYYSIVINNSINGDNTWGERAFMGLLETSDPASNQWEDKGFVICSSSDKGINWQRPNSNDWNAYFKWNAIDPTYVVTPENKHWMIYGSWHSGFAAVELNPETGKVKNQLSPPWGTAIEIASYGQVVARRNLSRWQGSEGPEIVYRNNYYYMFIAYDAVDVPYNTRVVRATQVTGPYYGIDGTNITAGGEAYPLVTHPYKFKDSNGWVGISHCAVFDDGNDNWYYASQGRLPKDVPGINASNAVMMGHIRSILWTEDGWPLVMPERYGGVPKVPVYEYELEGDWEYIDLQYEYAKQRSSNIITLAADHTITSSVWKGKTWRFDTAKQMLIIGETVKLYLKRETDWERKPRTHTIVFAGYEGTKTHWGKKKK